MDPARLQRVLRQNVRTEALLGIDALPMREGAPAPALSAATAHADSDAQARPRPAPRAAATAPPPAVLTAAPATARLTPLSRDQKLTVLQALNENEVKTCTRCTLCQARTQTVFGEGDPDAEIMFIGEGPGQTEDELGRPFVGRAGELLDRMIVAMGLQREGVYIANVVKCRPPQNRTPTPIETDACWPFLLKQVQTIQPKVIVTLGGPATKMIVGTQEGITRLRGTWQAFHGVEPPIPVMPTFHPAYLLRAYTKENRARVWSDLQAVMERLGKPTPKKSG